MHQERKKIMVKTLRIKEQNDTKVMIAKQTDQMYSFLKQTKEEIKQEYTQDIDDQLVEINNAYLYIYLLRLKLKTRRVDQKLTRMLNNSTNSCRK